METILKEYEARNFASCFDGRIATLTNSQKESLGISGTCYSNDNTINFGSTEFIFEVDRNDITPEQIEAAYIEYCNSIFAIPFFENVAFLTQNMNVISYHNLDSSETKYRWDLSNNYFGTNDIDKIEKMLPTYDVYEKYLGVYPQNYLETATVDMWPMVSDCYILDENGSRVTTIGTSKVRFVVEFNRDMADYVYEVSQMISLIGKKFHGM